VQITSYAPPTISLKAEASAPSVLMLDDRYDPDWHAWVDGKEQPVLRCDFILRGVYLPAGSHTIEFKFQPPTRTLWVSCSALGAGLVLLLMFIVLPGRTRTPPTSEKRVAA
jgi:uncharacterized membrane protein YfhO